MKNLRKLLCTLAACALILPQAAMAAPTTAVKINSSFVLSENEIDNDSNDSSNDNQSGDNANQDDNNDSTNDAQSTISTEEIEFVDMMIDEIQKRNDNIDLSEYDMTVGQFDNLFLNRVIYRIQNEYPELFYLNDNFNYTTDGSQSEEAESDKTILSVSLSYYSDEELEDANKAIADELKNITSLLDNSMSDVDKVLIVHDYIVNNYDYDGRVYEGNGEENRWIDKMVTEKRGVCQAYSHLFKYVMDNIGIDCEIVSATELEHMWNKVKIDDKWYNIDLTYDDPELGDNIMLMPMNYYHSFFLVSDDEIKTLDQSHHSKWDLKTWDDKDVTVSTDTSYPLSALRNVTGPTVSKNGKTYCLNDYTNEEHHYIMTLNQVDTENDELIPVYTFNSTDLWYANSEQTSYYQLVCSNLISYKGEIYFNSPSAVLKFNPEKENLVSSIYDFDEKNPTKTDSSHTYLYGLIIKDDILYAEYATAPYVLDDNDQVISAEPSEYLQILPESFPYSYAFSDGEDGQIVVTLNIPDTVTETPTVYIAEYDENNVLLNIVARNDNSSTVTFTPNAETKFVKAFIWSQSKKALSSVNTYTVTSSSNSSDEGNNAENQGGDENNGNVNNGNVNSGDVNNGGVDNGGSSSGSVDNGGESSNGSEAGSDSSGDGNSEIGGTVGGSDNDNSGTVGSGDSESNGTVDDSAQSESNPEQ